MIAALAFGVGVPLTSREAGAAVGPACKLPATSGPGERYETPPNCCTLPSSNAAGVDVDFACEEPEDISPAVAAGRPNILLLVADDQAYCQYGFMHGVCDGSSSRQGDCRSNIDCPGGQCVSRTTALSATAPLRLAEYTCRYRQPPSRKALDKQGTNGCLYKRGSEKQPDPKGSKSGDQKAWPFHQSDFPCTTTNKDGVVPDHPVPHTPHLDRLATHGAVFPRAYVTGNACKSSRSVIHFGKTHRHMVEMDDNDPGKDSIASWLNNGDAGIPPASNNLRYVPLMLGKGEVVSQNESGYQGGIEKAKTKLAKYDCDDGEDCRDAADTFEIPYEARLAPKGVGDVPDVLRGAPAGVVRPTFEDHDIIVWEAAHEVTPTGQCSDEPVCGACDGASPPGCCATECVAKLQTPFFLWYAPNQPHKRGRGHDFRPYYDATQVAMDPKRLKHDARLTHYDQGVGAVIDELKRMCVCGEQVDLDATNQTLDGTPLGEPERQSLWEHTVVITISDHGFFLPGAKGGFTDNSHRTPIIVSEPNHRRLNSAGAPVLAPAVHTDEIAHAIDVFRTVLDYGGDPYEAGDGDPIDDEDKDGNDDYRFGRSLKPWVQDPEKSEHVRDVAYSEDASQGLLEEKVVRTNLRPRYLVTRPGLVGICMKNGQPRLTKPIDYDEENSAGHARPCFLGGGHDCDEGYHYPPGGAPVAASGYSCEDADVVKRCVNNPAWVCTGNADCVDAAFCDGTSGKCDHSWLGSFGDMARPIEPDPLDTAVDGVRPSADCVVEDLSDPPDAIPDPDPTRCVPAGVDLCQPIVLKVQAKPVEVAGNEHNGDVVAAWDLLWDPDQRHNLLADDLDDYLGDVDSTWASLKKKFDQCLDNYWRLDGNKEWDGEHDAQSGCAWVEAPLPGGS